MKSPGCGDTQGSTERWRSGDGRCVRPALLVVEPAVGQFGMVPIGMTKVLVYTVRNVGTVASGPLASRITGAAVLSIVGDTCRDRTLAGNASCTVDVRFAPTAMGLAVAELELTATPGGRATAAARGTGAR